MRISTTDARGPAHPPPLVVLLVALAVATITPPAFAESGRHRPAKTRRPTKAPHVIVLDEICPPIFEVVRPEVFLVQDLTSALSPDGDPATGAGSPASPAVEKARVALREARARSREHAALRREAARQRLLIEREHAKIAAPASPSAPSPSKRRVEGDAARSGASDDSAPPVVPASLWKHRDEGAIGDGFLPRSAVRRVVGRSLVLLGGCFRAAPATGTLDARLTFTIGAAGRVTAARATGDGVPPETSRCLERRFRKLAFPPPEGGFVEREAILLYRPLRGDPPDHSPGDGERASSSAR